MGLLGRVDDHGEEDASEALAFDVGAMENKSPRHALGMTLGLVADTDYTRLAVKPRYRRWLGTTFAVDVAPGLFLPIDATIDGSAGPTHGPVGFVGEVGLSAGDWISITGMVEIVETERPYLPPSSDIPSKRSETEVAYYLGAKAGGEAGLLATFLMILALVSWTSD